MKKIAILIFTLLLGLTSAWADGTQPSSGSGTPSSPYLIANESNLIWFRDQVNTTSNQAIHAKLTADITLTQAWTPIGTSSKKYTGTFDGQEHTISGLSITSSSYNVGFFGYINGATIKNFSLAGSISASNNGVGSVVGRADGSSLIENVRSSVNITISGAKEHIGGIVGWIEGSTEVTRCIYSGTFDAGSSHDCLGGIVGYALKNSQTYITFCQFSGSITTTTNSNDLYLGGILGYIDVDQSSRPFRGIKHCFNRGTLSHGNSTSSNVGGIIGSPRGYSLSADNFQYNGYTQSGLVVVGNGGGNNGTVTSSNNRFLSEDECHSGLATRLLNGSADASSNNYWRQTLHGEHTNAYPVLTTDPDHPQNDPKGVYGHNSAVKWWCNDPSTHNYSNYSSNAHDEYSTQVGVETGFSGMGTVSGNASHSRAGTCTYTVTATPNIGYHFVRWSDGSTDNPHIINLSADVDIKARFAINTYTITVNVASVSNGRGTVSGGGTFNFNTSHQISATPNPGFEFLRWDDGNSENPRTIGPLTSNVTRSAEFSPIKYNFTLNHVGHGTVTASITLIGGVAYNQQVTITATPTTGYHFVQWNDGNTNAQRSITMPAHDVTYTATFAPNQYPLTVSVADGQSHMGSVSGGGTFDYQSQHTITATPNTGYHFTQWTGGSTSNPRTVTIGTSGNSYTANFAITQYSLTVSVADGQSHMGSVSGGGNFNFNTEHVIEATPTNDGFRFVEWNDHITDNPRTVTIPASNVAYSASFEEYSHTISAQLSNLQNHNMGSVTINASRHISNQNGTLLLSNAYTDNPVTVTATPATGHHFVQWIIQEEGQDDVILGPSGNTNGYSSQLTEHNATLTFSDNSTHNRTVIARFEANSHTITFSRQLSPDIPNMVANGVDPNTLGTLKYIETNGENIERTVENNTISTHYGAQLLLWLEPSNSDYRWDAVDGLGYNRYSITVSHDENIDVVIEHRLNFTTSGDTLVAIGKKSWYNPSVLVIPEGVRKIGYNAFAGFAGQAVELPSTLEVIAGAAFYSSTQLTSVTIPESVGVMEAMAFGDCSSLRDVYLLPPTPPTGGSGSLGAFGSVDDAPQFHLTCNQMSSYTSAPLWSAYASHFVMDMNRLPQVTFGVADGCDLMGSVTSIPAPSSCSSTYLTAVPNSGFRFTYWGDAAGQELSTLNSLSINDVQDGASYFAHFVEDTCTIRVSRIFNDDIPDFVTNGLSPNSIGHLYYRTYQNQNWSIETEVPENGIISVHPGADLRLYLQYDNEVYSDDPYKNLFRLADNPTHTFENPLYGHINHDENNRIEINATNINHYASLQLELEYGLTIQDGVLTEKKYWFNTTRLVIPEGVTAIGDLAFYDGENTNLFQQITLPSTLTSIGGGAFNGCQSLQSINFPDGLTSIGGWAFSGCQSLQSINFPDGLTSIGEAAFSGCQSLQSIYFPDGLTSIGEAAFDGCQSLQSIYFPDGLTSIGDAAFYECQSIQSITLPSTLSYLGAYAFLHCNNLSNVYVLPVNPPTCPFPGQPFDYDNPNLHLTCNQISSYSSATTWSSYESQFVMDMNRLPNVTASTAQGQDSWGSVSVANQATSCSSTFLTAVPADGYHFVHWSNGDGQVLSTQNPLSLGQVSDGASYYAHFEHDPWTVTVSRVFSQDIPSYVTNDIDPNSIGHLYYQLRDGSNWSQEIPVPQDGRVMVPDGLEVVLVHQYDLDDPYFHYFQTGSHNANVPSTLYFELGNYYDVHIERVEQDASIEFVMDYGFEINDINQLTAKRMWSHPLNPVIPEGVTSIEQGVFAASGPEDYIESVTLPSSLEQIGGRAFEGQHYLQSIIIPDNVFNINVSAFEGCVALESIALPDGIVTISENTFNNCQSLQSITLPSNLHSIQGNAFHSCSALQAITLPSTLGFIGDGAFEYCSNLTDVYALPSEAPTLGLGGNVFGSIDDLQIHLTTCDQMSSYSTNETWSSYADRLVLPEPEGLAVVVDANCTDMGLVEKTSTSIKATPAAAHYFSHWTYVDDQGTTQRVDGDEVWFCQLEGRTYTAHFDHYRTISTMANPMNAGTAMMEQHLEEEQETTGTVFDFKATYANDAQPIRFSASPSEGYIFVAWSNGCTQTEFDARPDTLGNCTMTAYYEPKNFYLYANPALGQDLMGHVEGSGLYAYGSTTTITAVAERGYEFLHWGDGSTDNPRTVTVGLTNEYVAYFGALEQDATTQGSQVTAQGGTLTIAGAQGLTLSLYDMQGRLLGRQTIDASPMHISNLATGVYMVQVGKEPAQKIVIVR